MEKTENDVVSQFKYIKRRELKKQICENKEDGKKEYHRNYNREYYKHKYNTDPEYRKNKIEKQKIINKQKMLNCIILVKETY